MIENPKDKRSTVPETITPIPYRPTHRVHRIWPGFPRKWLAGATVLLLFSGFALIATYVFSARIVSIRIDPTPSDISIRGRLLTPSYRNHYLLRPGKYTIFATKPCYTPLETQLEVDSEKRQNFHMTMHRLPGKLSLRIHPEGAPDQDIQNARIFIDGQEVGAGPLLKLSVPAGDHTLHVQSERYQDYRGEVSIQGCEQLQEMNLALKSGGSDVSISSVPSGAQVLVDGQPVGKTPVMLELSAGTHTLQLTAEGHNPWQTRLETEAGVPAELSGIRLEPADGKLTVKTSPEKARVMIGKNYVGQTPLEITLSPATPHLVHLSKAGYKDAAHTIELGPAEEETLDITLEALKGIIHFSVQPPDAELFVNGRPIGKVPRQLSLLATTQKIEIRKKGYKPYQTRITPRPGFPQDIRVAMESRIPSGAPSREVITAHNGYTLKLIRPGAFMMGSSRGEQGRRSNETLRNVRLKRPFHMGIKEVTNREFREFLPGHHSGNIKTVSLNSDQLPVVQVTWEQAALYCNWLSATESLPAAYVLKNDRLVAAEPMTIGYRLPTEAEWEYCASHNPTGIKLKYPWGAKFPPKSESGNYADASAKNLLANTIEGYNDGQPAAATPGKYPPNPLGFFDLGGNVAEWCHDFYSIYSYNAELVVTDPSGPSDGSLRVIRGSSWRHASISTLRLAYRDYGSDTRADLGFRICRYAK